MLFMKKRGEWLKERREELKSLDKRKYSMRAVAERVGISSAGMSHLENTDAMPSLDLAMKLAKELDRPIEWILNGTVTYGQRGIPIVGTTLTGPNSEWLDSMGRSGSYNEFVD
ncbi:helix-turn-helix transcriptional regulator, partial [Salmonella enterica subsp. enterica serovar Derby]|nr:helix-turn-helix transcriptional regulator [Salmonella enterica subsp. enterica serovar Derby]